MMMNHVVLQQILCFSRCCCRYLSVNDLVNVVGVNINDNQHRWVSIEQYKFGGCSTIVIWGGGGGGGGGGFPPTW